MFGLQQVHQPPATHNAAFSESMDVIYYWLIM